MVCCGTDEEIGIGGRDDRKVEQVSGRKEWRVGRKTVKCDGGE